MIDRHDAIRSQRVLAERLQDALLRAAPDSRVRLRGSLAAGTDDQYSDVDLAWTVPDGSIPGYVDGLPTLLAPVAPVASIRSDPDFQRSQWRRLIFVRFAGLPLFWRLDLEMWAASHEDDDRVDLDNPDARGTDWSRAESAMMNAIAAIKALRRGRSHDAKGLLDRGFARITSRDPGGSFRERIITLADAGAHREPRLADLAAQIRSHAPDQPPH